MSILGSVLIAAFEKELELASPEIEAYMLKVLGTIGSELMAYVTKKVVAKNPPTAVQTGAAVQTPQSVE